MCEHEWQRYAMEVNQMIVSNRTENSSASSACEHEQRKFRRVEETFAQCRTVIER